MFSAMIRTSVIGLACLLLQACLYSDEPLLTATNAKAQPLAEGPWLTCTYVEGELDGECSRSVGAKAPNGGYLLVSEEKEATRFFFKRIARGAWLTQMIESGSSDSYLYLIARRSRGDFVISVIMCEATPEALKLRLIAEGKLKVDAFSACKVSDLEAVIAIAKAHMKNEIAPEIEFRLTRAK